MVSLESAYGTMEDDEHQKQDHHDTIKMTVTESPTSTTTTTTTNTTSSSSSNSSTTSCSNSTSTSKDNETNNIPEETTWKGKKPPHKASNDENWVAIQKTKGRHENEGEDGIGLSDFRLLKKLGRGDIGSVYLVELKGTECLFAMKVMDKGSLAGRKKMLRAKTEREILGLLDHPFLPTLYATFETQQFSCLVMEYCSGGDLHTFRQRQANKRFSEDVVRFYASEVLLALEYLHMMGVIYRDLKPENVLVREDGHIMLTDFDLSLRCVVRPTLVKPVQLDLGTSCRIPALCVKPPTCIVRECVIPACIPPTCFMPGLFSHRFRKSRKPSSNNDVHPRHVTLSLLPELVAEPTSARSMSFVGTHEYLAPEIIRGEGHGSSVDWWTFGIFLYELLHGKTPFKGLGNHATLANVTGQPLKFPDSPSISSAAKDLIKSLLAKEPQHRLGIRRGATEIKQHPFFDGVNWALVRSNSPPQVPKPTHIDTGPVKQVNPPDNDSKPNDVKKVDFDVY